MATFCMFGNRQGQRSQGKIIREQNANYQRSFTRSDSARNLDNSQNPFFWDKLRYFQKQTNKNAGLYNQDRISCFEATKETLESTYISPKNLILASKFCRQKKRTKFKANQNLVNQDLPSADSLFNSTNSQQKER
eukprot:TRINITY_DN3272_c2_g1_i2.p10 TRINITY_DN3272_c2_g1~~TRINITY_DN3272_c2_g1_i2.p10  ORF type:complete len:135 (-),score=2.25 TRINITY_DN3272_c2_g1_i2:245-649(-)